MSLPIRIIFPCYPYKSEEQLTIVQKAFEDYGLKFVYNPNAIDASVIAPYSNSHEKRAQDLIEALEGPEAIIWAFGGGTGCQEIVDYLELKGYRPLNKPKLLIGYSDIVHLHGLWAKWGWPSIHGMVAGRCEETYELLKGDCNQKQSLKEVANILTGKVKTLEYPFQVIYSPLNSNLTLTAKIFGGNAYALREMQGTSTAFNAKNCVLFIEDMDPLEEELISRQLLGLVRSGLFNGIKAIIFGDFPIKERNDPIAFTQQFINMHLKPRGIDVPVVYSKEFGHGDYNHPLPLGTDVELEIKGHECFIKWVL